MKGDIVKIQNRDELLKRLREEIDERVKPRLIFLYVFSSVLISRKFATKCI
jgi:hypothetical protein